MQIYQQFFKDKHYKIEICYTQPNCNLTYKRKIDCIIYSINNYKAYYYKGYLSILTFELDAITKLKAQATITSKIEKQYNARKEAI